MEHMQLSLVHIKMGVRIFYQKVKRITLFSGEEYFKVEVLLMSTSTFKYSSPVGGENYFT